MRVSLNAATGADIFSQLWADTSVDGREWGMDALVWDQSGGVAPTLNLMSADDRVGCRPLRRTADANLPRS